MTPFLSSPPSVSLAGLLAHQTLLGGWTGHDEAPAPDATRPVQPAPAAAHARQVDEARSLTLSLQQRRGELSGWDRTLIREVGRWRRPPNAYEAQAIAEMAERLHWRDHDRRAPC